MAILENGRHLGFSIGQSDRMDLITIEKSHTNVGVSIAICTIHLKNARYLLHCNSVTTCPKGNVTTCPNVISLTKYVIVENTMHLTSNDLYTTRWLPGFARVPYYAPSPYHMHPGHNCHHMQSSHPPDEQYTSFIIDTCSLFFICNTKGSMETAALWEVCEYTGRSPPQDTSLEVSLPCSLAPLHSSPNPSSARFIHPAVHASSRPFLARSLHQSSLPPPPANTPFLH